MTMTFRHLLLATLCLAALAGVYSGAFAQVQAQGEFDAATHPTPPDYARNRDWAEWRGGNPRAGVDVFFVQPTTYVSKRWNQDLGDLKTDTWTRTSVGLRQISLFSACCRVYSPRYRQASSRAFAEMSGDGMKAYALAFEDVRAAFRYYVAHENHGRPFVLAGHSQGALHIMRLLREEIDGRAIGRRLVVAYAPGIGIPVGTFGTELKDVVACDVSNRTGCVASWNSFLLDADVASYIARAAKSWVAVHGVGPGAELLCVNPLTSDRRRPAADAAANLGGMVVPAAPEGPAAPVVPGAAGARCESGVLRVSPAYPLTALPGGSLHYYDIPLFWANLRADVARRIAAFPRRGR